MWHRQGTGSKLNKPGVRDEFGNGTARGHGQMEEHGSHRRSVLHEDTEHQMEGKRRDLLPAFCSGPLLTGSEARHRLSPRTAPASSAAPLPATPARRREYGGARA